MKQILKEGFAMHYCEEDIYLTAKSNRTIGIPMLCFSDVTLSFLESNIKYGEYAIAVNKVWGWKTVHLEPVAYYPNNSRCLATQRIITASNSFLSHSGKMNDIEPLGYSKPYHSIKGKRRKSTCNYLDREWRTVAKSSSWLEGSDPNLIPFLREPKPPYGNNFTFKESDVDYIIIKEEDQEAIIYFIWRELEACCGEPLSEQQKLSLISKLLIREQLIKNI